MTDDIPEEWIHRANDICSLIAEHGHPACETIAAALLEVEREATERERERAALLCESVANGYDGRSGDAVCYELASSIRRAP